MYLKRLELAGFKSFADRTIIEFAPGITAIVGPNGSGKSNIVDAIRWVLGEQSVKSLRGLKMDEVIFAGSAARRPLGYSEVIATFDNSDQRLPLERAEIGISRRLYRSGESEYFCNKKLCRLRDIYELFMDTGIGKDSYSVIGQGKIDNILSSKSGDRRAIFEEVAGIIKYRYRKEEAQKKLISTEQNIIRLQDILTELSSQNEILSSQAAIAKQYIDLKDNLKEIEVGLYVFQIEDLDSRLNEVNKDIDSLQEELVLLAASISEKETLAETLKLQILDHSKYEDRLQEDLLKLTTSLEQLIGDERVERERANHLKQIDLDVTKQLEELIVEISSKENIKEELLKSLESKSQKLGVLQEESKKLEEELAALKEKSQNPANKIEEQLHINSNDLIGLDKDHLFLTDLLSDIKERLDNLEEKKARYDSKITTLSKERTRYVSSRDQIVDKLSKASEQQNALHIKAQEIDSQIIELTAKIRQQELEMEGLFNRQKWLFDLENSNEGLFRGVKEILKLQDPGVHGVISQLLRVDPRHLRAIETALGSSMQYLVVDNEKVAQQSVQYLRKKNLGRATFLPLNIIQPRKIKLEDKVKCKSVEGFLGMADRLVEADKEYANLVSYLLGLVVVTTDLKEANNIARAISYRYKIVTLDGDTISIGGAVSGGSRTKSTPNLLGRTKELEELSVTIAKKQSSFNKLKESLSEAQENSVNIRQQQEKLSAQIADYQILKSEAEFGLRELDLQITSVETDIKQIMIESADLQNKFQKKSIELQDNAYKQTFKKQQIVELQEQIELLQEDNSDYVSRHELISAKLLELRVAVAKHEQDIQNNETTLNGLTTQIANYKRKHHTLEDKQDAQARTSDQVRSSLDIFAREKSFLAEEQKELKLALEESRKRSSELLHEQALYTKKIKLKSKELYDIEAKHKDLELLSKKLGLELDYKLQKLATNYEISYERAKADYKVPVNLEEATGRIEEIKSELKLLGDVNISAIQEYDKLHKRLDFLQAQETDLIDAKAKLTKIILDIEKRIAVIFKSNFESIRQKFQVTFKEVFGGGSGDITLSDTTNVLTSGVEIWAQPPGKKTKSLSLLSGGERSLTAIALLFAILKTKPSPFCILDEVDAALDEVNLTRFMGYLRDYANFTQFIMVTHRKQSMEKVDILYGVTMKESQGVSEVISMKLQDIVSV